MEKSGFDTVMRLAAEMKCSGVAFGNSSSNVSLVYSQRHLRVQPCSIIMHVTDAVPRSGDVFSDLLRG